MTAIRAGELEFEVVDGAPCAAEMRAETAEEARRKHDRRVIVFAVRHRRWMVTQKRRSDAPGGESDCVLCLASKADLYLLQSLALPWR